RRDVAYSFRPFGMTTAPDQSATAMKFHASARAIVSLLTALCVAACSTSDETPSGPAPAGSAGTGGGAGKGGAGGGMGGGGGALAPGEVVWSKRFGDENGQIVTNLALDATGRIALMGVFLGNLDFGLGAMVSAGATDIFMARLDGAGAPIWNQRFGS